MAALPDNETRTTRVEANGAPRARCGLHRRHDVSWPVRRPEVPAGPFNLFAGQGEPSRTRMLYPLIFETASGRRAALSENGRSRGARAPATWVSSARAW